jgi:hypothetical protein
MGFSKNHYNSIFFPLVSAAAFVICGIALQSGLVFTDFDSAGNFRNYKMSMDTPSGLIRYTDTFGDLCIWGGGAMQIIFAFVMFLQGWHDERSPIADLLHKRGEFKEL